MTKQTRLQLNVVQLYPDQMNIYGDNGNAQIICRRAELYGYDVNLAAYNSITDKSVLLAADIILGGGGQDSGQSAIVDDLQQIKPTLLQLAESKVPMLMICGLYQLFGHYFQTKDGKKLTGIGLFDLTTAGGDRRLIGNAVIANDELGEIIGYENHSGVTALGENQAALGRVVSGYGNDGTGTSEGAIKYAVIGTYMHGPVLSKNSKLADWLIRRAVERKYNDYKLVPADDDAKKTLFKLDRLVDTARAVAKSRPR
ncbi:MAG: glutamine amidotransferase [Candidatus Saccharibacteria bacterium]|nr:glutamine amidotransferase [Candidatus Saccharibacteria bacterium]